MDEEHDVVRLLHVTGGMLYLFDLSRVLSSRLVENAGALRPSAT